MRGWQQAAPPARPAQALVRPPHPPAYARPPATAPCRRLLHRLRHVLLHLLVSAAAGCAGGRGSREAGGAYRLNCPAGSRLLCPLPQLPLVRLWPPVEAAGHRRLLPAVPPVLPAGHVSVPAEWARLAGGWWVARGVPGGPADPLTPPHPTCSFCLQGLVAQETRRKLRQAHALVRRPRLPPGRLAGHRSCIRACCRPRLPLLPACPLTAAPCHNPHLLSARGAVQRLPAAHLLLRPGALPGGARGGQVRADAPAAAPRVCAADHGAAAAGDGDGVSRPALATAPSAGHGAGRPFACRPRMFACQRTTANPDCRIPSPPIPLLHTVTVCPCKRESDDPCCKPATGCRSRFSAGACHTDPGGYRWDGCAAGPGGFRRGRAGAGQGAVRSKGVQSMGASGQ